MPQHMHLNRHGQVVSHHCRDLTWNFNNFISALYKELKSWRRVYWRLWGNCHYLYCATCETHFPLYKMNWCLYHPDQPQYLGPVTEGRMAGPAGRYPCCGQMTFRYETLPGPSVILFISARVAFILWIYVVICFHSSRVVNTASTPYKYSMTEIERF